MPISCTPSDLVEASKCYCFSQDMQNAVEIYLLCNIRASEPPAPEEGCGALTIWAYYKCEGSPEPDLVGSHDLTPIATPPVIVAGLIGNAWETSEFFGWIMQNVPGLGTSDWDFSGTEFSMRFWFYLPSTGAVIDTTLCGTDNWGFMYRCTAGVSTYTFRTREPFTGVFRLVEVSAPASIGWHYILGWFRPGVEIGIHVDLLPSVVNQNVLAMKSDTGLFFAVYNPFSPPMAWRFDEIAIWKCVPSEEQILIDINNGLGQTYPNIIGA